MTAPPPQDDRRVGGDAPRRGEQGAALIAVLWAALLVGVIGSGVAVMAEIEARRTAAAERQARAEAAAAGGLRLVAVRLFEDDAQALAAAAEGRPVVFQTLGADLQVRITPESDRIDLNTADAAALGQGFVALGAAPAAAQSLAAAVIDWRDPDDLRTLSGAEAADYRAAGLAHGPRDGPFLHLSEIGQVLGVDAEIAAAADRVFTVHGAWRRPVQTDWPSPERDDPDAIDSFERFRGLFDAVEPSDASPRTRSARRRGLYRLEATARLDDGAAASVTAILAPDFGGHPPYQVLEWRD